MQQSTGTGSAVETPRATAAPTQVDWDAAVEEPVFRELLRRRRRFVVPATVGALAWMLLWVVLIAYAPDFMGESIYEGLTVAYLTGFSQYLVVWVLAWIYLRKSRREWGPLQRRAIERLQTNDRRPA
jgi:uncharacterized membrane protein (DUF485 family)